MRVNFHDIGQIDDEGLDYAVIVASYQGKWVFVQHRDRTTWEIPGGRREPNESIIRTARRELFEETGALKFDLSQVCDYSVTRDKPSYGRIFLAEITELSQLPTSEIARTVVSDALPEQMTYPDIQPSIFEKALSMLRNNAVSRVARHRCD